MPEVGTQNGNLHTLITIHKELSLKTIQSLIQCLVMVNLKSIRILFAVAREHGNCEFDTSYFHRKY